MVNAHSYGFAWLYTYIGWSDKWIWREEHLSVLKVMKHKLQLLI